MKLLGESRAQSILKRVLAYAQGAETEAVLTVTDSALTRFANNAIHQNVAEVNTVVCVRVVVDRRVGMVTTNDISDAGLARVVADAQTIARVLPKDPSFPGLPQPRPIEPLACFDAAAAGISAEQRAQAARLVCTQAHAAGLSSAGALAAGIRELAVANSHGIMAYHSTTFVRLTIVTRSEGGSGYSSRSSWRLGDISAEVLGRQAVEAALRARSPRMIEPGVYPVILMPYATFNIVTQLGYGGMGAQLVQEGRSWMNERIGQPLMSPNVNIWDDGYDRDGLPLPFDFEGVPKQRVDIVTAGVPRNPVYDTLTASREPGRVSTGHAFAPPNPSGPLPLNLVLGPGQATLDEMIRSTERGLLITRFWYTRPVHPRDCVVTGMTRDGLFWIERGELAYPVKNLRFTQSYVSALANVESVGRDVWTVGEDASAARVPALKLREFAFTGATEF
jgi:predicted Zn-dependent protease